MPDDFLVAHNPEPDSRLPYLIRIPLGTDGIVLKARELWPRVSKVYCHRADGWPEDAEVIEGHIRIPIDSTMSPRKLLHQVEYAEFLRKTDLDRTRPSHDIRPTSLGRYDEIVTHVEGRRRRLSEQRKDAPVSISEAAADWYDNVYLPIVLAVREQKLLREFPDRSEADVYLWVMANRLQIQMATGSKFNPENSAQAYREIVGDERKIKRIGVRAINAARDLASSVRSRSGA